MNDVESFGGERSGYDARKGFSELLIDIIRAMMVYNNQADLASWEMFARNYYSATKKFIDQKTQEKCELLMKQVVSAKYVRHGKTIQFNNKWQENNNASNKITILLMELQQELIQSTTHLLTPSKETDDEQFNPEGVL